IRCRWILRPHLRSLRIVAVPRPRLKITKLLIHAVKLGESLGDQSIRRAMIGEQIVADAVPSWTPQQLIAAQAEKIAGLLQMRPVAQLERGVKMPVPSALIRLM